MNTRRTAVLLLGAAVLLTAWATISSASSKERGPANPQQKKEYLTDAEADKIRDAETPSERIKLFLSFASDRLKKFQYETGRTAPERHRAETLNGLLNGYIGCVDDAADLVSLEVEKQADIHDALKEMIGKGKEFLAALQKIRSSGGPELDTYKENLDDAIEGTGDALQEAEKARKGYTPPVRRKPS
ncbi:MAG: hypothetical protein WBC04_25050 [Candidatus Acidiferrales bacterium]